MQGSMDLKSKSLPKFLCIQFIYINFAILKKHYSRSIMSVWNKMISIYFNIMNKVSTVFSGMPAVKLRCAFVATCRD